MITVFLLLRIFSFSSTTLIIAILFIFHPKQICWIAKHDRLAGDIQLNPVMTDDSFRAITILLVSM